MNINWILRRLRQAPQIDDALRDAVEERLADDELKRALDARIRSRVRATIATEIVQASRLLTWVVLVIAIVGLGAAGWAQWAYNKIQEQQTRVQASLDAIGDIPELIIKSSPGVQELRRQETELEKRQRQLEVDSGMRRWEIVDRLEDLETYRNGVGPRLTALLRQYVRGSISKADYDAHVEKIGQFGDAMAKISGASETQDERYKKEARPLLFAAIDPPGAAVLWPQPLRAATEWLVGKASFAEPRIKYASLRITAFSEQVEYEFSGTSTDPGPLFEAKVRLDEARMILSDDRNEFYAKKPHARYLLAEVEYQTARYHAYLREVCPPGSRKSQPCTVQNQEGALTALDAAARHYRAWRALTVDGDQDELSLTNPRHTYLRARILFGVDDLVAAERFAESAIVAAQRRKATYFDALNLAAWTYAAGYERTGPGAGKPPKDSKLADRAHYERRRFRAILYAQRAVSAAGEGVDDRTEALETLAFAFKNYGWDAAGALTAYDSLMTIASAPRDNDRWRSRMATLCQTVGRYVKDGLTSEARSPDPYRRPLTLGLLHHVRAVARDNCASADAAHHVDGLTTDGSELSRARARNARLCSDLFDLGEAGHHFEQARGALNGRDELMVDVALARHDVMLTDRFEGQAIAGCPPSSRKRPVVDPDKTLARLEADTDYVKHQMRMIAKPRISLRNNIVWKALLVDNRATPSADDLVVRAGAAVLDDGMRSSVIMHTLATALYEKAVRPTVRGGPPAITDRRAFDDGAALIEELALNEPGHRDVQALATCFREALGNRVRPVVACQAPRYK